MGELAPSSCDDVADMATPGVEMPQDGSPQGGIRGRAVRGVAWSGASQVGVQLLHMAVGVVLARLLMPRDFGLLGMAVLFTGLVTVLNELGLCAALIQRPHVTQTQLSTVFWANLALGVVCALLTVGCAPLAARFFHNPLVAPVVMAMSSIMVITALGSVHQAMLFKELEFRSVALIEFSGALAYGVVAVALAWANLGVWSLVVGTIIGTSAAVVMLWRACAFRPRLLFRRADLRSLLGFGVYVWAFNLVNYARENVDFLLVGRVLGATPLGLYTLAYSLANVPRRKLMSVVSRVAFPAFSKVQDDDARLRSGYLNTITYTSLISFPILAGLAAVAPEFVRVVYGPKWLPMVRALQILCGVGMLYSISSPVGSLFLSRGRPDLQFKIGIASLATLTVFILVGLNWGILGVAAAGLVYASLFVWITQAIANRLVGLKMVEYLSALAKAGLASGGMAVCVLAFRLAAGRVALMPDWAILTGAVAVGIVAYLAILRLIAPRELGVLISLARLGARAVARGLRRRASGSGRKNVSEIPMVDTVGPPESLL